MAFLYANENFPYGVVQQLRSLGHDVLTVAEAGNAGQRIPDATVLAYATQAGRAVLTINRRDFVRLHRQGVSPMRASSHVPRMPMSLARRSASMQPSSRRVHWRIRCSALYAPIPTSPQARKAGNTALAEFQQPARRCLVRHA